MSNALEPRTFAEAIDFAKLLAKSELVPTAFRGKPDNVLVAIQWGREIGLGPLQALQNIAIIQGRPAVWGDAMMALVRGSGICAGIRESIDGDGDAMVATCVAKRKDDATEIVATFSVADAKKAGLWGKAGPWQQYPRRMLQMRARGFALRDAFPDVLRGVISAEEAADIPAPDTYAGPTIDMVDTAPPKLAATMTSKRDLAEAWVAETLARIKECVTVDALSAITSDAKTQKYLARLDEISPDLAAQVKEALYEQDQAIDAMMREPVDGEVAA